MAKRKMKQQATEPKLIVTSGKKIKRYIDFALSNRKSSKKKQLQFNFVEREMEERFKQPKAEMEENSEQIRRCRSNAAPKKGRKSSLLEVGAKVERLEEEVAAKRAETTLLRQQLIEEETKVEANLLGKLSNLRTLNALLFLENLRDQDLVDDLARRILG